MDYLIPTAYAQAQKTGNISAEFGFGNITSLGALAHMLILPGFSIAATMVMFYFIIGAFEMITSQGDKAHIVSARAKIYHAIIGFILLAVMFLIFQYLPEALGINFRII